MEIHKILTKLDEFNIKTVVETGAPAYIQTHKMIKPGQTSFFSACLYAGYVSELPERLITDQISNLICIEDKPLPKDFIASGEMNLYLVPNPKTNQFDILNKIADIMIDEATIVSAMRRILDELYKNTGLQALTEVASEVFENPIFINDTAFKILAMSQKTVFSDNTLEEEKKLGYIHADNLNSMKRDRAVERYRSTDEITYSERADKDERWLFKSVKLHGITVADIAIVDNNRPFRDLDYELLDRFSKIVAIEMEKNEFYKDNKGIMYSYFLADLFSGKLQSQKTLEQRIKLLNWKLYGNFQLAVINDSKSTMHDEKIQFIGREIRNIIADCRWTYFQKNFVIFLSRPNEEMISGLERTEFRRFLKENNLYAGVSAVFSNLRSAAQYYTQALRCAEAGVCAESETRVFYYDETIPYCAAMLLSKRYDLEDFRPSCVLKIQKYDSENKTNLLETLEKYLFYVNDPVSAAKALNIHRNTLLYRIHKAEELSGADLGNGDVRLAIQLYLKFLKYQKNGWQ